MNIWAGGWAGDIVREKWGGRGGGGFRRGKIMMGEREKVDGFIEEEEAARQHKGELHAHGRSDRRSSDARVSYIQSCIFSNNLTH